MSCRMFLFPLTLLFVASGSTLEPCYRFTFPSMFQNMTISTTEGSSITLPFKLDTGPCPGGWNRTIHTYVEHPPNQNNLRQIFCAVTFGQRGCKSSNKEKCACLEGTFGDIGDNFSKTVSKADSGSWLWRTGDGLTMEIHFDIKDHPTPDSTALVTSSTSQENGREQKVITEVTRNDDTQSSYAPQVRGPGSIMSKGTLLAVIVASCTAVVLAIVLLVTCRLSKRLAAIKKRRSWTGFGLNQTGHIAPRNPYVVPNILYGGSNVSMNIVNDIYQSSMDMHTAAVPKLGNPCDRDVPPRCGAAVHVLPLAAASIDAVSDEEGDYAEIHSMKTDCNEGACRVDDVYISVEEIRRRKAEQQKQK